MARKFRSEWPPRHSDPSGCEAYTAIGWDVGLSHERSDIAGAEGFHSLEGHMCGTAMRGADALPGSKATSRAKGSHRKLGGLGFDRTALPLPARIGKVRKPLVRAAVTLNSPNKGHKR
jgi:hypothetical protein